MPSASSRQILFFSILFSWLLKRVAESGREAQGSGRKCRESGIHLPVRFWVSCFSVGGLCLETLFRSEKPQESIVQRKKPFIGSESGDLPGSLRRSACNINNISTAYKVLCGSRFGRVMRIWNGSTRGHGMKILIAVLPWPVPSLASTLNTFGAGRQHQQRLPTITMPSLQSGSLARHGFSGRPQRLCPQADAGQWLGTG